MAMPDPVQEDYYNCVGNVFSVGGTYTAGTTGESPTPPTVAGGVELAVQTGGVNTPVDVDETTNNTDGGYYSDVATIKHANGSFTCSYKQGAKPAFVSGNVYPVIIADTRPGGTFVFQGNCRFSNVARPYVNVKNGMTYSFDITAIGPYTLVE